MNETVISPPNSIVTEASLLGCLLHNNDFLTVCEEFAIKEDDFYEPKNRVLFRSIYDLVNSSNVADITTVSNHLATEGFLGEAGGIEYLMQITEDIFSVSEKSVAAYAEIVKEKSLHRKMINICRNGISSSMSQEDTFENISDRTTTELVNLSNEKNTATTFLVKDIVQQEIVSLRDRLSKDSSLVGLDTGYDRLNDLTSGLKGGEMIVVAGRPGMGKTSFALNLASNIARTDNPVLFFSLEMPKEQLVQRIIASECGVNSQNLMTGRMEPNELKRLWEKIDRINKLPIYIDDSAFLTIPALRSKTKKLISKGVKLKAIFIDYLQLMNSSIKDDNRVRQIEDISRNIKLFAKDMNVPIIALAQLSRKVEERSGKKIPMLSDLRDSGSIEQDSDLVMFVHREEMYDKNTERRGTAELYLEKNRHGATGVIPLMFVAEFTKFRGVTPEEEVGFH